MVRQSESRRRGAGRCAGTSTHAGSLGCCPAAFRRHTLTLGAVQDQKLFKCGVERGGRDTPAQLLMPARRLLRRQDGGQAGQPLGALRKGEEGRQGQAQRRSGTQHSFRRGLCHCPRDHCSRKLTWRSSWRSPGGAADCDASAACASAGALARARRPSSAHHTPAARRPAAETYTLWPPPLSLAPAADAANTRRATAAAAVMAPAAITGRHEDDRAPSRCSIGAPGRSVGEGVGAQGSACLGRRRRRRRTTVRGLLECFPPSVTHPLDTKM